MQKPKSFFRVFTETGPLVALAVAIALLIGIAGPASAQFFNFGGPPPQQQRPAPRPNQGPVTGHPRRRRSARHALSCIVTVATVLG